MYVYAKILKQNSLRVIKEQKAKKNKHGIYEDGIRDFRNTRCQALSVMHLLQVIFIVEIVFKFMSRWLTVILFRLDNVCDADKFGVEINNPRVYHDLACIESCNLKARLRGRTT